jgi:hypothetical protein
MFFCSYIGAACAAKRNVYARHTRRRQARTFDLYADYTVILEVHRVSTARALRFRVRHVLRLAAMRALRQQSAHSEPVTVTIGR